MSSETLVNGQVVMRRVLDLLTGRAPTEVLARIEKLMLFLTSKVGQASPERGVNL